MKSLLLFIALNLCALFFPAKAQDPRKNTHTFIVDGSVYHFSTTIKEKQSFELSIKHQDLKDSVEIYGDISTQQIRSLLDAFRVKQIAYEQDLVLKDLVHLHSEKENLEKRLAQLRDSLNKKLTDPSHGRIVETMTFDTTLLVQKIARLAIDSNRHSQRFANLNNPTYFSDSVYFSLYHQATLFINNFSNEKTADNWGMSNAQFAEIEAMESALQVKNDSIDNLYLSKRAEKKLNKKKIVALQEKEKAEDKLWTTKLNQLKKDSALNLQRIKEINDSLTLIPNQAKEKGNVSDSAPLKDTASLLSALRSANERLASDQKRITLFSNLLRDSILTNNFDLKKLKSDQENMLNNYDVKIQDSRNERNRTGKTLQKYKRKYIQPSVYLSGSAFAYLNKTVNNDSMRSNILAVGLYAEKGDLSTMDMQITFGQSEDIISGNNRDVFGASILVPGIRSLSFLSNFNQNSILPNSRGRFWRHMGYGVSFNVSQVQWRWTNSDSMNVNNGNAIKVVPVAMDAYLSYNWLKTQKSRVNLETKTDIYTDIGLSSRWIWGNASQSAQILRQFTGSDREFYLGFLFGCKIKVDRLTIFYHGVLFPNEWYGGIPVPGLTGGQIVSSLGFRADIVKFK